VTYTLTSRRRRSELDHASTDTPDLMADRSHRDWRCLHADPPPSCHRAYIDQATSVSTAMARGWLSGEATCTSNGTYLHTTSTLGPVPTEARQAIARVIRR
jgi:hypothetical protein